MPGERPWLLRAAGLHKQPRLQLEHVYKIHDSPGEPAGSPLTTTMAATEVVVEIGGIAVLLRATDERLAPLLESRFGTFAGSGRAPQFLFDISVTDHSAFADPDADVAVDALSLLYRLAKGVQ